MKEARRNDQWIGAVRKFLRLGLGVEDIALHIHCDVEDVRREVRILRESGELAKIYRGEE